MTSTDPETWGNHAWNLTQVDNAWYLVDLTGDGGFPGICGYSYFLVGTPKFSEGYRYESTSGSDENIGTVSYSAIPAISATAYEWEGRP